MLSARLTSRAHLSHGIHYVALLRDPIRRFLSEFYETYDGWEATFATPPYVNKSESCSARLPPHLRERARSIDATSKSAYDELFPFWIQCPTNMAASRQTRTLSYAALLTAPRTSSSEGMRRPVDTKLRESMCRRLARGANDPKCSLQMARAALYRFSLVGLNSERCATERLLEAQFGVRLNRSTAEVTDGGKGAHRVAKLAYDDLDTLTRRRVRDLNQDDLLLYAEARQLFRRRLKAYGIPRGVKCR